MIGTFLASKVRVLGRVLVSRGLDGRRLLREAGLDPSLVRRESAA